MSENVHPIFKPILDAIATDPTPQPLLMADASVIRAAIFDVLDRDSIWDFDDKDVLTEDEATEERGKFAVAVEKRIRELQATPHNLGIKLGNYCVRHLGVKLGLPEPSVLECVDCKTERLRQG